MRDRGERSKNIFGCAQVANNSLPLGLSQAKEVSLFLNVPPRNPPPSWTNVQPEDATLDWDTRAMMLVTDRKKNLDFIFRDD